MSDTDTIAQINDFVRRFGEERNLDLAPLDDAGVTRIQRGSALISIHAVTEQGVLLLLSKVMDAPDSGGEALFRRLLELSFLATGDAGFAINKKTGEIYLRALRRLEGMDYDEFEDSGPHRGHRRRRVGRPAPPRLRRLGRALRRAGAARRSGRPALRMSREPAVEQRLRARPAGVDGEPARGVAGHLDLDAQVVAG